MKIRQLCTDIQDIYCIVLMKESPALFRGNKSFIHNRVSTTDSGISLSSLVHIVYVELDKCLKQVLDSIYPKGLEELCMWLSLIADVNGAHTKKMAERMPEIREVCAELSAMSHDKEEMTVMLMRNYDEMVRNTELSLARKRAK